MSLSKQPLHRVGSIDALRGLAAIAVLIYHARGSWWIGASETYHRFGLHFNLNAWLGYLTVPLSFGSLGVTLFFVLSGYCIHRRGAKLLTTSSTAKIDYKEFFLRRFWRIYPTYVAALLVTALVDWWIRTNTGIDPADQDSSFFAFAVSLLTLQGYLAKYFGSNGVFWTLAMEVHLYLVYPVLFFLSKHRGPRFTLLFTFLIAIFYNVANNVLGIEQHLPFRFSEGPVFLPYWFTWAIGFYLAEIEFGRVEDFSERTWQYMMLTGAAVGLFFSTKDLHMEAKIPWALFFAGLVRWSLHPKGQAAWTTLLGRGLAFIGVFSYSLYAIHAPLLWLFHVIVDPQQQKKYVTLCPAFAAAICAIVVSWMFFRLVEYRSLIKTEKSPTFNSLKIIHE